MFEPVAHLQVLEWLDQDLRLSACMWMRVARFIQAKGTYLLQLQLQTLIAKLSQLMWRLHSVNLRTKFSKGLSCEIVLLKFMSFAS